MAPKKKEKEIQNFTAKQLRYRATRFLNNTQNKNMLTEILDMFKFETRNYSRVILCVEMIFTKLLQRKDMFEVVVPLKIGVLPPVTPESLHIRFLREAYETAITNTIACMKKGYPESRIQAMVSAFKMLKEEGMNPVDSCMGIMYFPHVRLKDVFTAMLEDDEATEEVINRFQEFADYRDIQQYGLKVLSLLATGKAPSLAYVHNYLHLFETLMAPGLPPHRYADFRSKDDNYYVSKGEKIPFIFNPTVCRRYINRAWGIVSKWPLRLSVPIHRRALTLLVDKLMPHLARPVLATDLLCDSLDCGPTISHVALRGMLELVTKHKIDYPDIYDRLYAMFEPEIFATRSKKRLITLADVFLGSTRISETLVAAFAKRVSRLALLASPDDAHLLLTLVSSMLARHPGLKKMIDTNTPAVMPKDPYVMDESRAISSRAIQSSLWEVAALKSHFTPEVSASASRVLAVAQGIAAPDSACLREGTEQFDTEIRKRFKSIEVNFVRYPNMSHLSAVEKLSIYWNMDLCTV